MKKQRNIAKLKRVSDFEILALFIFILSYQKSYQILYNKYTIIMDGDDMEIKKEILEQIDNHYMHDDTNKIVRCALDKNKISEIVRDKEIGERLLYNFSNNIETLPVKDQKSSGRCWIFAGCNVLREAICKKYNLEDFELSQNFIAFYDKLEKCNYIMECLIELKDEDDDNRERYHILTRGIEDGGQWDLFVNIVNKYGIVPKEVMNETYQSSNTSEVNDLLNRKLRQFNARIKNTNDNLDYLKSLYLEDIYRILTDCFGLPTNKFDFEYTDKDKKYHIIKDLTPLEFYKKYTDINVDDYVSIINAPTKDKPFNKTYTVKYLGNVIEGKNILYLNLPMEEFKSLVVKQLEAKEVVWFGSDCSKDADRADGLFDDLSFNYNDTFKTDFSMTKEDMLDNYESAMNHAMVITGVNLDRNIPTKWKIENSWGEQVGDKGYYVASDTWFEKYVYQAVINKKYLSSEQLEELKLKPVELKPWDPMGTLALLN